MKRTPDVLQATRLQKIHPVPRIERFDDLANRTPLAAIAIIEIGVRKTSN
jgi:hypothetical protein